MVHKRQLVLFFALVFAASGCVGGGGSSVDNYGDQAIAVQELQVTPTEIFEDSTVRVRMSLSNVGEIPAELLVAKSTSPHQQRNTGSQIMTNHCPDVFDVNDFSASATNASETKRSYKLAPGHKVRMNWELEQDGADVPLNGYKCNLRFEVPFNYSVEAFRQIEVKDNSDVVGSEELFAKSSKGPMKLVLEAIGSSSPRGAPTFLKNDSTEVLVQLENKKPEETSFKGTVELNPPEIEARGMQFNGTCPDSEATPENGKLVIYQGESKVFRCDLMWPNHDWSTYPSFKGEVYAKADYTYVKSAGTKSVDVRFRGD